MPTGVETKGVDEFSRKLERLKKNMESLDGSHEVPLTELCTPEFLRAHSRFSSFEELVRASGLLKPNEPVSAEAFRAIPDDSWEGWIAEATDFKDWRSMQEKASTDFLKRRMFEGV